MPRQQPPRIEGDGGRRAGEPGERPARAGALARDPVGKTRGGGRRMRTAMPVFAVKARATAGA
uniref:hypothetical protein n=1 Tax=Acidocella sp. C78 TaxID=1671486 RepID=UPI0020BFC1D6|nr:hypothetical protein [Acidocella sp. C78]